MYSEFLSLLNIMTIEDARYSVLSSQGPFEVRLYPRLTCVKVAQSGDYDAARVTAQELLEEYLEGCNFKAERIEKASPLFQVHHEDHFEFGLLLPNNLSETSAPKPLNRFLRVEAIGASRVGVLRFKGEENPDTFKRRADELKKWLSKKGHCFERSFRVTRSDLFIPFPFVRQHEVHISLI